MQVNIRTLVTEGQTNSKYRQVESEVARIYPGCMLHSHSVFYQQVINLVKWKYLNCKGDFIKGTFCGSSSESKSAAPLFSLSDILESTTEAGKGLGRIGSPFPKLGWIKQWIRERG